MKAVFILILFLLSACLNLKAQQPVFVSYPSEQYPPVAEKISCLYSNGFDFIWMGTDKGLLRFDGQNFTAVTNSNTEIPDAMEHDSSGRLWIAIANRLYLYGNLKNQLPLLPADTFNHSINDMLADGSNLWIATAGGGLLIRTENHFISITASSGLSDEFVYCLEKDEHGNIWAGTDRGISIISHRNPFSVLKKISTTEGLPDAIVRRIKKADDGSMMIGMQHSGIAVADRQHKILHVTPSWSWGEVNDIVSDSPHVWIATEKGGLVLIPSLNSPPVSFRQSETQNFVNVSAATGTADGFLWFASEGRLYKTAGMKWAWIKTMNGKPIKNIHAVFTDSRNNLWFTPDSGLVIRHANNSIGHVSLPGIRRNTDITCFYEDDCQNLWIGTMGSGLYLYQTNKRLVKKVSPSLYPTEFQNILSLAGKGNTLWVATFGGVFITSAGNCTDDKPKLIILPLKTGQRFGNFYVYDVFIDSKGKTWFATDGSGLACYDHGEIINFDVSRFSKDNVVYSIAEDNKGSLWFTVHEGGLIRFDGKKFYPFTEKEGLKSNAVLSVIHDGKNRLVLTYENGIDFFNTETEFVYSPGKEFGFENINPDLNAATVDRNNNLWIGTSQGIIKLSPDYSPNNLRPHSVICHATLPGPSKFISNGESLSHNENLISVLFCGFWNAAPEQLIYRYKLNNSDAWISTGDRQIVLSGLNPGRYQVTFQASHHPSFLFSAESSFHFTIMKPLWKRTWFLALLAFALAAFIFMFIRLRENQLRKMEILEKEKTIYQYETLKSQVNPHFLFNSLNTLISVIETEPRAEAAQFAQQLSDFFRSSLSLREKEFISLKDEMDMAHAFIQILAKRFGNRIVVKTEINRADFEKKILPMVLQMLIENALKHNAATADFPLRINIKTENGYISVANNINPKKTPEASTQTGLHNIINRYRHYGREDVVVMNDGKMFTVKLPLLNSTS